jgi:phosphohistidine phosphatase SixA
MPIYLVQHGLSVVKAMDPDRPLSAEGRKEIELVATHLRRMFEVVTCPHTLDRT